MKKPQHIKKRIVAAALAISLVSTGAAVSTFRTNATSGILFQENSTTQESLADTENDSTAQENLNDTEKEKDEAVLNTTEGAAPILEEEDEDLNQNDANPLETEKTEDTIVTGWQQEDDVFYYYNAAGVLTMEYSDEKLYKVSNGKKTLCTLGVYEIKIDKNAPKLYLVDQKGVIVKTSGFYVINSTTRMFVSSAGYVTSKFVASNKVYQYYMYDYGTAKWNICKSVWKSVCGNKFYFSATGNCSRLYKPAEKKCYNLVDEKWILIKNNIAWVGIDPTKPLYYCFDSDGVLYDKNGWKTASSSLNVLITKEGNVSDKMYLNSKYWSYAVYDASTKIWKIATKSWKSINGSTYYFNVSGYAGTRYDEKNKIAYKLSGTAESPYQYALIILGVDLDSPNYYMTNGKGEINTTKGWARVNSKAFAYVGADGYVTHKMALGTDWQYMKYDMDNASWTIYKSCWKSVLSRNYYFTSEGICNRVYDTSTKKGYNVTGDKETAIKNAAAYTAVSITNAKFYYFNSNGIVDTSAGTKNITDNLSVYVGSFGYITQKTVKTNGVMTFYNYNEKTGTWDKVDTATGEAIVAEALKYIGVKYVSGGNSLVTGVDCSGFAQQIYKKFGISIPRTCPEIGKEGVGTTIPIDLTQMKPGDLVLYCFPSTSFTHVAIYIGNGQVVHALNSNTGVLITDYDYARGVTLAKRFVN